MVNWDEDDEGASQGSWRDSVDESLARAFGLGTLAGIVLLGLVWVTVAVVTDDPATGVRAGRAGLPDQSRVSSSRPPKPTAVERCATAAEALDAPLRAAGPALDQWQVHVGAMNKLVVGAITLQQATAFWTQTRVGAKARISDFHRAERVPRRLDVTCPVHRVHADESPELRACMLRVRADRRALHAARTAVHTWEMHVADMERLRSGKLSPAAATTMWLSMWQRGVKELHGYHAAAHQARHRGHCDVPVS